MVNIDGRRHGFAAQNLQSEFHQLFAVPFGHIGGGADDAGVGVADFGADEAVATLPHNDQIPFALVFTGGLERPEGGFVVEANDGNVAGVGDGGEDGGNGRFAHPTRIATIQIVGAAGGD